MEFGIDHYYESKEARIFLGFFSFKMPLFYSDEGYCRTISFDRLGFYIEKDDVTRCYYWRKIFKLAANHRPRE